MAGDLEDILSGKEPAPVAPEVEETGAAVQAEPAQPEPVAVVTPTPEPEKTVPLAALMAERSKRQEIEARWQAQAQAAQPKPDFYADPENYVHAVTRQNAISMSVAMAEAQYPDFRERLAVFMEEAQKNPVLAAQAEAHAHPALFAYQQAKRIEEFRSMQDVDAYKARLRTEIEAEVKARLEAEQAALHKTRAAIPPDLTVVRGSKQADAPTDESIRSILGR